MSDLKPCPFCGGKARVSVDRIAWYVECSQCNSESGRYAAEEHAVFAWNCRENDVKSVVRGEWELDSDNLDVCSVCGEIALQRVFVKLPHLIQDVRMVRSNFCPNCGADMRGK